MRLSARRKAAYLAAGTLIAVLAAPSAAMASAAAPASRNLYPQASLVPAPTASDFGQAVAVSGGTAAVGETNAATPAAIGDTFVYTRSGSQWTQQAELTDNDPGAEFGYAVAMTPSAATGDILVVGSPDGAGGGAVYVFTGAGGHWTQPAELTGSDTVAGDGFGSAVAVSGDTVVVGAPYRDSDAGAAYVFTGAGGHWTQRAELTGSDTVAGDGFGSAVAVYGDTVAVGAPGRNGDAGAAYVFTGAGGHWTQRAELTGSDTVAEDTFGSAVSVSHSAGASGDVLAVGAPLHNTTPTSGATGAAYVFTGAGSSWTQRAELDGSNVTLPGHDNGLGSSVAVCGTTVVVGAQGIGHEGLNGSSAFVFTPQGTSWAQRDELFPSDTVVSYHFGAAVALSGTTAIVGAVGLGNTGSAAFIYAL
jgi:archaellin